MKRLNRLLPTQEMRSELADWFGRNMGKFKPEKMGGKETRHIKYSCWDRVKFPSYKDFYKAFGGAR